MGIGKGEGMREVGFWEGFRRKGKRGLKRGSGMRER